jgi:dTMP kinase
LTGRFIALEGGEASGKSTQTARLARRLDALATFEPGATSMGSRVRAVLLDPATEDLDDRTAALMMIADRAQHVHEVVRPALDAGRHVVTDRFAGSTLAYQGYGRGLDVDELRSLSSWATDGLWPDLTVLLEVPAGIARERLSEAPDRFEGAGGGFHERVAAGFLALAAGDPTWVVVDGVGEPEAVASRLWDAVTSRLPDLAD